MKYRMVIRANGTDIFDVFSENLQNDYFAAKGKLLAENRIRKGFSYQKNVSRDKRKKQQRMATVEVLDFIRPSLYRVSYKSDRYRSVTGVELKQVDEDRVEIIVEEIRDKIVTDENGKKEYVSEIPESDTVKKASLWKKYQYRYMAKSIRLRKQRQEKEAKKAKKGGKK